MVSGIGTKSRSQKILATSALLSLPRSFSTQSIKQLQHMGNVEPGTKTRATHFTDINPESSQSLARESTNFFILEPLPLPFYRPSWFFFYADSFIHLTFLPFPSPVPLPSFLFKSIGPNSTGSKLSHHEHTDQGQTYSDS